MPDPPIKPPLGPPLPPVTDGELLMRYTLHGETAALEEVIERHRAMIWGVCTRILARQADAEDAYQATLLILARKAGSVRANDSAAGWLFRVAHNAAIAARRRRLRRRETTLEESPPAPEEALPDLARQEVVAALLEELRSLPTKYQTALALRYLEGRSRREIATALDATVATVAGQLVRGRRLLRSRLARRGVSLGLALGAFGAAGTAHAAAVVHARPPAVDLSTLLTGSSSAASAGVHTLVSQGIRSMFYASVTKPAAVGAAVVVAAAALLVDPPEGIARSGEGAPRINVTMVATNDEGGTSGQVRISDTGGGDAPDREAPERNEAGNQDPGASPAESAPATPDQMMTVREFLAQERNPEAAQPAVEGDADPVAKALEAFAKQARQEEDRDLNQPSFEELYWQYEHWNRELKGHEAMVRRDESRIEAARANYDRVKTLHDAKPPIVSTRKLEEAKQALRNVEASRVVAQAKIPLARAKVAEFERLLKQAALRETALKDLAAAIGETPERDRPVTPSPVASPVEGTRLAGTFIEDKSSVSNALEQFDLRGAPASEEVNATFLPGPVSPEEQRKTFDNLKKHYAEQVAAEDRDLSQTSFEEYYWQVAHWRRKLEALQFRVDVLNRQGADLSKAAESGKIPRDELLRLETERMSEVQAVAAELPLAKANLAKYERLRNLAAVRETGAKPVAQEASSQPDPKQLLTPWFDFQARERETDKELRPLKELKLELERWIAEEASHRARMQAADAEIASGVPTGEISDIAAQKIEVDLLDAQAKVMQALVKQAELERLIERAEAREKEVLFPAVTPKMPGQPVSGPGPSVKELALQLKYWRNRESTYAIDAASAKHALQQDGELDDATREDLQRRVREAELEVTQAQTQQAELERLQVREAELEIARARAQQAELERSIEQAQAREKRASSRPAATPVTPGQFVPGPAPSLKELELQLLYWKKSEAAYTADAQGVEKALRQIGESDDATTQALRRQMLSAEADIARARAKQAELERLIKQVRADLTTSAGRRPMAAAGPTAFGAPQPFVSPLVRESDSALKVGPFEVPSKLLAPGDAVLVDCTLPENVVHVNKRCVVEADGTIGLGAAIGRVKISGLTMRQAEKAVQEHFDKEWETTIQLTPEEVVIPLSKPVNPSPYGAAPPPLAATPRNGPILVGDPFTYAITDQSNGGRVYNGAGMVNEDGMLALQLNPGTGGEDPTDNWAVVKVAGLDVAEAEATIRKTLRDKFGAKEVEVRMWRVGPVDQRSSAPLRIYPGVDGPRPQVRF